MKKETGRKIIILGCPGSGKSTLAIQLAEKTGLPLVHLDQLWWKEDRSHISRPEFDRKLAEILQAESWIIDGDYSRTYEVRFQNCDTVIFLDYPEQLCLNGIRNRVGTFRTDLPWIDEQLDPALVERVERYRQEKRPEIYRLMKKYPDRRTVIFHTRKAAARWLAELDEVNYEEDN